MGQAYPAKPIRMIVPFPPGGGTDIAARTIANKLSDSVKWTFVVENKPGAGGNLGVEQAVTATIVERRRLFMGSLWRESRCSCR